MANDFRGWYFRCQSGERSIAVIPAVHRAGGARSGSVQVICGEGCFSFPVDGAACRVDRRRPRAVMEDSRFDEGGLSLCLRDGPNAVRGEVRFGPPCPIRYDIMGPFRFVPFMECRHSVFSLRHTVSGCLRVNGTDYRFQDGLGYIEGDRGRSFPRRYLWTQCFFTAGSLMLSVAEVPLGPARLTGVIGAVRLGAKEYRLATYLGARAVKISGGEAVIRQGGLTLTAALLEDKSGALRAPVSGAMTRLIRENIACRARYSLTQNGRTLLSLETDRAAFEYEY